MAILTLTSDFGQQDYLAGAVKGQLLKIDPDFRIHDITHQLSAFNYPQAAYVCCNAFWQFPSHSYHIILLNFFDQKPEQLLLAFHKGQYLICADNGLLNMIASGKPEMVTSIPLDKNSIKNILHCTGVIGQLISDMEKGMLPEGMDHPGAVYIEKNTLRPLLGENYIEGQIIFIDQFENVIVNITRDEFEEQRKGRSFRIVFKRDEMIDRISESYADVAAGEKLALFNSANHLEIAINQGNAAGLFGLQHFSDQSMQHHLFYQTIRVYFE